MLLVVRLHADEVLQQVCWNEQHCGQHWPNSTQLEHDDLAMM